MTLGQLYAIFKDKSEVGGVMSKDRAKSIISVTPGIGNLLQRGERPQDIFDRMEDWDLIAQNRTHLLLLEGYR